jgi:hypothetical protein
MFLRGLGGRIYSYRPPRVIDLHKHPLARGENLPCERLRYKQNRLPRGKLLAKMAVVFLPTIFALDTNEQPPFWVRWLNDPQQLVLATLVR